MTKLPRGIAILLILLVLVALVGCSASTSALPIDSLIGWNLTSPAEGGQFQWQSAGDSPIIHNASVQPTKVLPGDTMTVTAEVSDSSGIKSVTADMGDIETISLSLIQGSIYRGTWQGQWLVHDTTVRDYVTTIVATNSIGKSSATDVLWSDPALYERYHKEIYGTANTLATTMQTVLTLTFSPNVDGDYWIIGRADIGQTTDLADQTEAEVLCYFESSVTTTDTTTTVIDSALTEADDFWNTWWILEWTGGSNIGEYEAVLDFVAAADTLSFTDGFTNATTAGDTYKLYRVINSILFYPNAVDEAAPFGCHYILSLDDAKTYNFVINYRSVNGTNNATVTNYGINAINIASYGGFPAAAHGHDEAGTSANPGAWQTQATASISGTAGDYLVIASLEMQASVTNKSLMMRILEDSTTGWGEISRVATSASQWHLFQDIRRVTVGSGAHTFELQWDSSGKTATVRRCHIAVINIASMSDTPSSYTEEEGEEYTESTTWVTKMSHVFSPGTSWNGLRLAYAMMSSQDRTDYVYGGIDEDGTEIGTSNMMPNAAITDYQPLWTAFHRFHTESQWTIGLKYMAEAGGVAYSQNDRVLVIRMDNLIPFSDPGHATFCDAFDTKPEDTIYIQGCFYQRGHYYHVAYYDNGGAKIETDTMQSDLQGVLESNCVLTFYEGTADPGTSWYAVAYENVDIATGTASADGTSTTLIDDSLQGGDGVWAGWLLVMYSGLNAGQYQPVTGYTASTHTLTTTAFSGASATGDTYRLRNLTDTYVWTGYGTADSGTTTTLVDDALAEADDYWIGWTLENITNAESQVVTDFATGTLTTNAFAVANASGNVYQLHNTPAALYTNTTGAATSNGATTTLIDTGLTEADDYWNGWSLEMLTGSNAGEIRLVTDFDAASDTLTTVAFTNASTLDDTYRLYDRRSVREYMFEVTADAIPEFPTPLAGIGVAGLCFVIYWWMRRRAATWQSLG